MSQESALVSGPGELPPARGGEGFGVVDPGSSQQAPAGGLSPPIEPPPNQPPVGGDVDPGAGTSTRREATAPQRSVVVQTGPRRLRSGILTGNLCDMQDGEKMVFAERPTQLITEIFLSPPPAYNDPMSMNYNYSGCWSRIGEEVVRNSPASWPDPYCFRTFKIHDVDSKKDEHNVIWRGFKDDEFSSSTTTVNVRCTDRYIAQPSLSEKGLLVMKMLSMSTSDRTVQASSNFSRPNIHDVAAEMVLVEYWKSNGLMASQDQAPLLRAGLLAMSYMDPKAMVFSDIVRMPLFGWTSDMVVKPYVIPLGPSSIPRVNKTSTVRFCSSIDYIRAFQSGSTVDVVDAAITPELIRKSVVVPCKVAETSAEWFIPYVMAFTTTKWWEGSLGTLYKYTTMPTVTGTDECSALFSPRASMVSVDGQYDNILIVMIDSGRYIIDQTCRLGPHAVTHYGTPYEGFSDLVYRWLGRSDNDITAMPEKVCALALHAMARICANVGTTDASARVTSMLAELCFLLPMGLSVSTIEHAGVKGPVKLEGFPEVKVGDWSVPDVAWTENNDVTIGKYFSTLEEWRVSPMGLFRDTSQKVKNIEKTLPDMKHSTYWPQYTKSRQEAPRYQVTEQHSVVRVMIMFEIFEDRGQCGYKIHREPLEFYRNLQFIASFTALTSAWWFLESGLPVVDFNVIGDYATMRYLENYWGVISEATLGFITPIATGPETATHWVQTVEFCLYGHVKKYTLTNWMGVHMTAPAIFAFMNKLKDMRYEKDPNVSKAVVVRTHDSDDLAKGYMFDSSKTTWYQFARQMSTGSYEKGTIEQNAWYLVYWSEKRSGFVRTDHGFAAWYPHSALDVSSGKCGNRPSKLVQAHGVIELLAHVLPTSRIVNARDGTVCTFVDTGSGPARNEVSVRMDSPDPDASWWVDGLAHVVAGGAAGGWPGALVAGAEYVLPSLLKWFRDTYVNNESSTSAKGSGGE